MTALSPTTPPDASDGQSHEAFSRKKSSRDVQGELGAWRSQWSVCLRASGSLPPSRLDVASMLAGRGGAQSTGTGSDFVHGLAAMLLTHGKSQSPNQTGRVPHINRFMDSLPEELKEKRFAQFEQEQKELVLELARRGWVVEGPWLEPSAGEGQKSAQGRQEELAWARQRMPREASVFLDWARISGAQKEALEIDGMASLAASLNANAGESALDWCVENPWATHFRIPSRAEDGHYLTPSETQGREFDARIELAGKNSSFLDELEAAGCLSPWPSPKAAPKKSERIAEPATPWLIRMLCFLEPLRAQRAIAAGASLSKLAAQEKRDVWMIVLRGAAACLRAPNGPQLKKAKELVQESFAAAFAAGLGAESWNHRGSRAPWKNEPGAWGGDDSGHKILEAGNGLGPARAKFVLEALAAHGVDLGADLPSMLALGAASTGAWAPKNREALLRWAFSKMEKKPQWTRKRWMDIWRRDLLASDASLALFKELGAKMGPFTAATALCPGPFELAMRSRRGVSTLRLLADLGAKTNEESLQGAGLSHWAAEREDALGLESLQWALGIHRGEKRAAAANAQTSQGERPIHLAAKAMNAEAIALLASAGAQMSAKNKKGEGVVRYLARRSGKEAEARMPAAADALSAAGADWSERDARGRVAIAWLAKKAPTAVLEKLARECPEAFATEGKATPFRGDATPKSAQDILARRGGESHARVEGVLIAQAAKEPARGAPAPDAQAGGASAAASAPKRKGLRI